MSNAFSDAVFHGLLYIPRPWLTVNACMSHAPDISGAVLPCIRSETV